MQYYFTEKLCCGGILFTIHIYAPLRYRRGRGTAGVFVLSDGTDPAVFFEQQGWRKTAEQHDSVVFLVDEPAETWNAPLADSLFELYSALCNWWDGGYSILTAFRGLAASGKACRAADAFCRRYGRHLAAAALLDPDNLPANAPAPACSLPIWLVGKKHAASETEWASQWQLANRTQRQTGPADDTLWDSADNPAQSLRISVGPESATAEALLEFLLSRRRWGLTPDHGLVAAARGLEGVARETVTVAGLERERFVYRPGTDKPAPLVVTLHGITSNGGAFLEQTGWDALARRHQFAVLAPTGCLNRWNVGQSPDYPDDCAFIMDCVGRLVDAGIADPSRIYLHGFSMGAALANRLMCRYPYAFAAAAAFSGHLFNDNDDRIAVGRDTNRSGASYATQRYDIPRPVRQYYGELEKPTDYPGDRECANRFWRRSAGAEDAEGECETWPGGYGGYRATRYNGVFFPYESVCENGLIHAYHPAVHEHLYCSFFSRYRRPENTIVTVSAERMEDAVVVRWRCGKVAPRFMLLLSSDGFAFPRVRADGAAGEMRVAVPGSVDEALLLPVYTEGSASAPTVVAIP